MNTTWIVENESGSEATLRGAQRAYPNGVEAFTVTLYAEKAAIAAVTRKIGIPTHVCLGKSRPFESRPLQLLDRAVVFSNR